ncbi:hypothetical protein Q6D67_02185 [Haliea sp. E1-2-M8]|uniref:calcium-binding protein n=1 Tax=Haliea sp. E1-2-M8 TaxID=3064706 RepID=UPI002718C370|nr:hypothetical protein [Haliea sp. E1-2-M8]MDO8860494.1 hypothetical protein [Haliea sp. E1-2-M8]
MASLKLSESAFGSVGLSITENLDLAALSASLTALLGQSYQIDSLDVSGVTQQGLPNFDPQVGAGGLTVLGLGLPGSRITIGAFDTFSVSLQQDAPAAISGFETLAFTPETVAFFGFPWFSISDGTVMNSVEEILTFDSTVRVFDYSGIGAKSLDVQLEAVAFGDSIESAPFSGFTVIGNDGDSAIRGNPGFQSLSYYGSNTYILGEGTNSFLGGFDNARVTGGSGRDAIFGGFGDDILASGAGNDILYGGESSNFGTSTLDGGAGNDLLFGSSGNHELTGGADGDRFVFANDYEIGVGEEGVPSVNTGFGVSDGENGTNVITDFTVGEDLLAFSLDDIMLDPQSGSLSLGVGQQTGNQGEPLLEASMSFGSDQEFFSIEDVGGAMGVGSVVFTVEQSTAVITDRQYLDQPVFILNQDSFFDGAYELVYRSADQSQSGTYDIFENLRLQPVIFGNKPAEGPIGGQDKFDLTALGLTDFVVGDGGPDTREIVDAEGVGTTVAGTEVAVEEILFTSMDSSYLLDRLLAAEPSQEDTSDFFLDNSDPDNLVYRAMHVEYSNIDGEEFIAYIDADRNGGFDLDTDMAFFVRLDFAGSLGLNDVTDLYNPLAADGGTGIFIFEESQYDFWLNDEFIDLSQQPG